MSHVSVYVERFSHSDDPRYSGDRGTVLSAETGYTSGRVFSTHFPNVYVTDNGEVEIDDLRVPADVAVEWLRAVADHIEARRDAS